MPHPSSEAMREAYFEHGAIAGDPTLCSRVNTLLAESADALDDYHEAEARAESPEDEKKVREDLLLVADSIRCGARGMPDESADACETAEAHIGMLRRLLTEAREVRVYPSGGDILKRLDELMERDVTDDLPDSVQSALRDMAALVSDAVQYAGRVEARAVPDGWMPACLEHEDGRDVWVDSQGVWKMETDTGPSTTRHLDGVDLIDWQGALRKADQLGQPPLRGLSDNQQEGQTHGEGTVGR